MEDLPQSQPCRREMSWNGERTQKRQPSSLGEEKVKLDAKRHTGRRCRKMIDMTSQRLPSSVVDPDPVGS
jgi:hypothetical protein